MGDNAEAEVSTPGEVAKQVKSQPVRVGPKWESDARDRVKAAIKKFTPALSELVRRDANEGDTRLLVTDFLCEGLGVDKYSELTTEYQVKGEYADYGIRVDKEMIAFIEVKRVNTKLNAKHLRQVQTYAINEGVEWVLLTNGVQWQAYHLTGGLPVIVDLALEVDLLGESTVQQKTNQLFYLTREALKKRRIDELWHAKRATSPRSLSQVLTSESVVKAIRKELRRATGHVVDSAEVVRILKETVFRPECFDR